MITTGAQLAGSASADWAHPGSGERTLAQGAYDPLEIPMLWADSRRVGCSATLGYLFFNDFGEEAAVIALPAGYAAGLVISLVPMPKALRVTLCGAGVITLLILPFPLVGPGLDRLFWFFVALLGILGWLLGFLSIAAVRVRRSRRRRRSLDQLG